MLIFFGVPVDMYSFYSGVYSQGSSSGSWSGRLKWGLWLYQSNQSLTIKVSPAWKKPPIWGRERKWWHFFFWFNSGIFVWAKKTWHLIQWCFLSPFLAKLWRKISGQLSWQTTDRGASGVLHPPPKSLTWRLLDNPPWMIRCISMYILPIEHGVPMSYMSFPGCFQVEKRIDVLHDPSNGRLDRL